MLRFPKIYRRFTETFSSWLKWSPSSLFTILFLSLLLMITILVGFDLLNNVQAEIQLDKQRQEIRTKIAFWVKITAKYKGYRDGYFELAVLEYRLGDRNKAEEYLQKALSIDPNFQEGRRLEQILKDKK